MTISAKNQTTDSDEGKALTLVVATGTFDLLHPGHVFYLERSRALGGRLVLVAAGINRPPAQTHLPDEQELKG